MSKELVKHTASPLNTNYTSIAEKEFVTMRISGQLFGIPVLTVRDVLRGQRIAQVPLAPLEIAGLLNLRGRIVTAINLRQRLGLTALEEKNKALSVVVEHRGEWFSLMVDSVGDVLNLPLNKFEQNPKNLNERWREVAAGVYRLDDELLVVLDIQSMLQFSN